MHTSTIEHPSISFMNGGGEMGRLMRAKDWARTSMGPVSEWPQNLKITLGIILNSGFPMFLFWGKDLICFYNDAYRPSLGNEGKHPVILGRPAEEAWPEIWDIIKPLIDQVMGGGGATWQEDQYIPIYRNGKLEDVYWTFSYSPVNNDDGKIGGVFVTCTETTTKVQSLMMIEESEKRFRNTVMNAPVGITIMRGDSFQIEMANPAYLQLVGKTEEEFIGKSIFDSLPEVRETIEPLLQEVMVTGKPHSGKEFKVTINRYGKKEDAFFNFVYQPLFDTTGKPNGIIVIANEVTKLVEAAHILEESEKRFSQMVMNSPIAMTIFRGPELIIEMANTVMIEKIWEKTEAEVIGKKAMEVFPELKEQKYPALLQKVMNTGTIYHENESLTFVKGTDGLKKFYLDFEYSPLFDTDGNTIGGVMITVNDVTEKVEARLKIEESEKKFRLLADSMPQHIWTSDARGNLNYFNQSIFSFSGLNFDEIANGGWIKIIHPDDQEENTKAWAQSIASGEPFLFEHRFRRHDGEYRWHLSRALPIKGNDGNIQMWVGTSTDIDEIKKYQQAKDDFIKIASHELKTPVTTIKAFIQHLLNQESPRDEALLGKSLATIDKQITKLSKLITDLLDVTKIEMGSFHSDKEVFSITELIRDVAENLQATTTTHQIQFDFRSDLNITADKVRITQVLANLLTNAIKYSPGKDKIVIHTAVRAGKLIVGIQDFGIGLASQEHEKIFERFYRAESTDAKTYPGFGIGLFIVREIIAQHKGNVWVESEKGKGSTFYFSLPLPL